jgi:hypothetical protein
VKRGGLAKAADFQLLDAISELLDESLCLLHLDLRHSV